MTKRELKSYKVILFGLQNFIKDFEYIFDDIDIVAQALVEQHRPIEIAPDIVDLLNKMEEALIIVCAKPESELKEKLCREYPEFTGRTHYAEALFPLLDEDLDINAWAHGRKIAILGTGSIAELAARDIKPELILIADGISAGEEQSVPVKQLSDIDINGLKEYYILVSDNMFDRGICALEDVGLKKREDFMDAGFFLQPRYSEMMSATAGAQGYANAPCGAARKVLYMTGDLKSSPCCPSGILRQWFNRQRFYYFSLEEVWNSMWFRLMRLSLINRSYVFCDHHFCPKLKLDAPKTEERLSKQEAYPLPCELQMEFDATCNLHCPSCRREVMAASPERKRVLDKLVPPLKEILNQIERTRLAGYGDVFASKYYQELLYTEVKRKKLYLLTNGVLLTEEKFDPLPGMYEYIEVHISIDAATPETYARLRPGGDWDKLQRNLEMISRKKKEGKVDLFCINFVAQADNYRELPAFVDMGERLGVSQMYINNIRDWGTSREFERKTILNPDYSIKAEVKPYVDEILNRKYRLPFRLIVDFVK